MTVVHGSAGRTHLGAGIGPGGVGGGSGRVGERPLPRSPDPCRAVRGQRRSSSPHPEAAAPGDELGRVRGRLASARQPDGVVHGRGDRGLARRAPDHAGGQPWYSPLAVLTALTLRAVFRLGLRQTGGLVGSILRLLGLELRVPDHATLSRRAGTLEVPRPRPTGEAVHLLVDSTGLRLSGPGEWLIEKHGTK